MEEATNQPQESVLSQAQVDGIISGVMRERGTKGGYAKLHKYGVKEYSDMAKKRWKDNKKKK